MENDLQADTEIVVAVAPRVSQDCNWQNKLAESLYVILQPQDEEDHNALSHHLYDVAENTDEDASPV